MRTGTISYASAAAGSNACFYGAGVYIEQNMIPLLRCKRARHVP
jgi:hypothetical protein